MPSSISNDEYHAFGGLDLNPGLKVRLTEALSHLIKDHVLQYSNEYLNWDVNFPSEGSIDMRFFPFFLEFNYSNMKKDELLIDMNEFTFNFTHEATDLEPVVYFKMPMIKSWNCTFDYSYKIWGIPFHDTMRMEARNVTFLTALKLGATSNGYLYPEIHNLDVNFSKTQIYMENRLKELFLR